MVGRVDPAPLTQAIGVQAFTARPPTLAIDTMTGTTDIAATAHMRMTGERSATMISGGNADSRGVMTTKIRRGSTAETRAEEASSPTAAAGEGNAITATLARPRPRAQGHGRGHDPGLDLGRGPDPGRGHDHARGRPDAGEGDRGTEGQATPPTAVAGVRARDRRRATGRTRRFTTSRALLGIHLGTLRLESAR